MSFLFGFAIVVFSSIWVLLDSKQLKKNEVVAADKGFRPLEFFFGCLVLWIFIFPMYLYKRAKLKDEIPGLDPTAPTTIGIILIAAVIINIAAPYIGLTGFSTSDLQPQVLASVKTTFSSNPIYSGWKVKDLTLIHSTGNQYKGVLIAEFNGTPTSLAVDVTYDGKAFIWQTRPM